MAAPRVSSVLRVAVVVFLVDVLVALIMTSGRPERPSFGTSRLAPPPAALPTGVLVTVRPAHGGAHTVCFLAASRARNLQGVLTFGTAPGLALVSPAPSGTGAAVSLAGSHLEVIVAFYGPAGAFVSSALGRPCPSLVACPNIRPARVWRLALEAAPLTAVGLGLGAGSVATAGGGCAA